MKFSKLFLLTCFLSFFVAATLPAETGQSSGTIAETIDAGGYTYIRIEESDTWIATTTMEVSKGQRVNYSGGAEMHDFHSKSLDRTFESIWFVGDVSLAGESAAKTQPSMPAGHPKLTGDPAPIEIEKLDGGKVIEEIFSVPASLDGQSVSLRAMVVKVSPNIMGKNWITLQDGTGSEPNNKLVATSSEMATVGEIVIAKGVIRNNVDLGHGYHYEALLEETSFTK